MLRRLRDEHRRRARRAPDTRSLDRMDMASFEAAREALGRAVLRADHVVL